MPLNAVERRLLDLRHQWERFANDPTPRLLVWTVPDAAMRLVRCFLEVQKHEGEYVTGDLFIVFDTPFENSIQYSQALKELLAGQHAASADDLGREGLDPSWPVDVASFPDSAYGVTQALRSLGGRYHEAIGHLVGVFAPSSVASPRHFAAWLARGLDAGLPGGCGFWRSTRWRRRGSRICSRPILPCCSARRWHWMRRLSPRRLSRRNARLALLGSSATC
jgi:hypothetical protein